MITNYWKSYILNSIFLNGGKGYIGLSTCDPQEDASALNGEITANSYSRVEIDFNNDTFSEPIEVPTEEQISASSILSNIPVEEREGNPIFEEGVTKIYNKIDIVFDEAKEAWATGKDSDGNDIKIKYWTLFDSQEAGTLLAYGMISPNKTIEESDSFIIPRGRLVIGIKNES